MISANEARLLQRSPLRIEKYLLQIEEEIENHCMNSDTGYIFYKISGAERIHIPVIIQMLERLGFQVQESEDELKISWFKQW